ncbi:MAG: flagellar hook-length control protein FliK [Gammaproteobacteria bacterium]|nr:flagellar hook-length control protein FliK [Gammaproteobacteria bacterium]
MKIPVTLQPLLNAMSQREIPSLLKQLQIGQVLPAKVLAQVQTNIVRLQLATTELLARTPVKLEPGTSLRLEVVAKTPLPELKILTTPTPARQRDAIVRSAMSRQLPARDVREALPAMREQAAPVRLNDAVQRFETILRSAGLGPQRPQPQQVRQAVLQSGLFHEALLRTGTPPPAGDMKRQLLQLLSDLDVEIRQQQQRPVAAEGDPQAPRQDAAQKADTLLLRLARLVESSVARVQLQQSTALPADDNARQVWQFDIPFHHTDHSDDIMLRIEREARNGSEGEPGWAVNLAFEFDTIGTLQCRIGLNGDRVATTFWCENDSTLSRVEQRLPTLQAALEAQGLEVVHLSGVRGEPRDPLIHVPLPDTLLDERA